MKLDHRSDSFANSKFKSKAEIQSLRLQSLNCQSSKLESNTGKQFFKENTKCFTIEVFVKKFFEELNSNYRVEWASDSSAPFEIQPNNRHLTNDPSDQMPRNYLKTLGLI